MEYALRGFGAEKFRSNSETGHIYVNGCGVGLETGSCLDFETQKSYALTYTGTDGGGQVTTTSVTIRVLDVNDNYPQFDQKQYKRVVQEGATTFLPPLVIQVS